MLGLEVLDDALPPSLGYVESGFDEAGYDEGACDELGSSCTLEKFRSYVAWGYAGGV